VEIGFSCVGGSYNNTNSDICTKTNECGDGIMDGNEECDESINTGYFNFA